MNIARNTLIRLSALTCTGILGLAGARWSEAQTPPPAPPPDTTMSHPSAQSEAGEPRAGTSPDVVKADAPGADAPGADAPGADAPGADAPRVDAPKGGAPKSGAKGREAAKAETPGKARGSAKSAADRLQLQTATVTGDQEQPKVMYIVPWKKSDIGDLSGKPMNSLLDEALAPVDRDEFKREVLYYQAVRADASRNGAAAGAAAAPAPPR